MVNYLYYFETVEQNYEDFSMNKAVAASAEVIAKAAKAKKTLQDERQDHGKSTI